MSLNLTVSRGDKLRLCVKDFPGGLQKAVAVIHDLVGPMAGSRATFAKLFAMDDNPAKLDTTDTVRLWLLLITIGEDPQSWGISADAIPFAYSGEPLTIRLRTNGMEGDYRPTNAWKWTVSADQAA